MACWTPFAIIATLFAIPLAPVQPLEYSDSSLGRRGLILNSTGNSERRGPARAERRNSPIIFTLRSMKGVPLPLIQAVPEVNPDHDYMTRLPLIRTLPPTSHNRIQTRNYLLQRE